MPTRIFLQVTIHLGNVLFVGFFLIKLDLWLLFGLFLNGRWHFFGGIDLVIEKFFELAGEENSLRVVVGISVAAVDVFGKFDLFVLNLGLAISMRGMLVHIVYIDLWLFFNNRRKLLLNLLRCFFQL